MPPTTRRRQVFLRADLLDRVDLYAQGHGTNTPDLLTEMLLGLLEAPPPPAKACTCCGQPATSRYTELPWCGACLPCFPEQGVRGEECPGRHAGAAVVAVAAAARAEELPVLEELAAPELPGTQAPQLLQSPLPHTEAVPDPPVPVRAPATREPRGNRPPRKLPVAPLETRVPEPDEPPEDAALDLEEFEDVAEIEPHYATRPAPGKRPKQWRRPVGPDSTRAADRIRHHLNEKEAGFRDAILKVRPVRRIDPSELARSASGAVVPTRLVTDPPRRLSVAAPAVRAVPDPWDLRPEPAPHTDHQGA